MMRYLLLLLLTTVLFVVGCSDNKVEKHVFKEKTDTIKKVKEVELLLQDAAQQQQQRINEQTH